MTAPDFAGLAAQHALGDDPVPEAVLELAAGRPAELVWRNELGGLTFRMGDEFVKWNPRRTGVDLALERSARGDDPRRRLGGSAARRLGADS